MSVEKFIVAHQISSMINDGVADDAFYTPSPVMIFIN